MRNFLILFLISLSFGVNSQKLSKDKLLDKISDETCSCIGSKDITAENYKMTFGLCVLEAASNHQKDVDRHYGKDLMSARDKLEQMGMEVGFKMASSCPDAFSIFVDNPEILEEAINDYEVDESVDLEYSEEDYLDIPPPEDFTGIEGNVVEIRSEGFLKLKVKEESGRISEFIVLDDFSNSYLITDKVLIPNDKVIVEYYEQEVFDVSLNKFFTYKVIIDISKK